MIVHGVAVGTSVTLWGGLVTTAFVRYERSTGVFERTARSRRLFNDHG